MDDILSRMWKHVFLDFLHFGPCLGRDGTCSRKWMVEVSLPFPLLGYYLTCNIEIGRLLTPVRLQKNQITIWEFMRL